MIELRALRKVFSGPQGEDVVAVDDVDLVVSEGETVCLIGTSGSGKTTTMKMINRLIEPTSGEVRVGGTKVTELDVIRLRRQIGYVIQKGGLFPHMTVAENIGLMNKLEGWEAQKTKQRVEELMHLVNLPPEEFFHRYPDEISGGQRQRVGVARSLALDPAYILMDEPFGALDPITREQIHDEFAQLKREVKKSIVLVTHDLSEAVKLGDKIALMDFGKLIQFGPPEDFLERPANDFVRDFFRSHLEGGAHV